jgi:hypothetical protein
MNFFKTLVMVGLLGVGMVYAESADTNKIVEIRTQILSFPKDTDISDKSILNTFRQNIDTQALGITAVLTAEQTRSLLGYLKKTAQSR